MESVAFGAKRLDVGGSLDHGVPGTGSFYPLQKDDAANMNGKVTT